MFSLSLLVRSHFTLGLSDLDKEDPDEESGSSNPDFQPESVLVASLEAFIAGPGHNHVSDPQPKGDAKMNQAVD